MVVLLNQDNQNNQYQQNYKFQYDLLQGACKGGHMDIVELMIEKGANDWNWGGGDLNMSRWSYGWDGGLIRASESGHYEIIKLLNQYCKNPISINLEPEIIYLLHK
jgi:ankyrin repeat protein